MNKTIFPLKFIKMQALKNDFVIIDGINFDISLTVEQIKAICDRKLGVGCDQLLMIHSAKTQTKSEFIYRIFNQDGSEAAQCGNGARCVIKYLVKYHNLANQEIKLITLNSYIIGKQLSSGQIILDMGRPLFNPDEIPFKHEINASGLYKIGSNSQIIGGVVSMGNPHFITMINNLTQLNNIDYLNQMVSSILQANLFPEGVNINFCHIKNRNSMILQTFERGCGFTESCGSGACASVAHAINQNLLDSQVLVKTLGGELEVTWNKNDNLFLSGIATEVYNGILIDEISV